MRIITNVLAIIGTLAVLTAVAVVIIIAIMPVRKPSVRGNTIIELDLRRGVTEYSTASPASRLLRAPEIALLDILEGLLIAADDPKVKALVVHVSPLNIGYGQAQEIRGAIERFKQSGKPAIAFAETFGEMGRGTKSYYLAAACDTVVLQPSGDIGLTGLISQAMFVKNALDKLDITPQLDHRKEFKSALYTFTREQFAEPQKEAISAYIASMHEQIAQGIVEGRSIDAEKARALIAEGPLSAQEGLNAGLVDKLAYHDQVITDLKKQFGERTGTASLPRYVASRGRFFDKGQTIALIYGVGNIVRGVSRDNPLSGSRIMGSQTIAKAFKQAIDNKKVRAIVFRIESPGGSYVASDVIWRETVHAREAGKPVIVSMSNVAGSGGYFVAASAEKIVAHPGTVTGSIGVISGKAVTTGFWKKLGVTWDELYTDRNATYWSSVNEYTPEQWKTLQKFLDRVYADFTGKVSRGRNLTAAQVEQAAQGRIWSGADALRYGLVDTLGGLITAIELAKQAAGIQADARIRLETLPAKKGIVARFLGRDMQSESQAHTAAGELNGVLEELRPLAQYADAFKQALDPAALRMPNVHIE